MKGKMISECVWSGETAKPWKCKPIKAIGIILRLLRSLWNSSKKESPPSLADTQTRNPSALILLFLSIWCSYGALKCYYLQICIFKIYFLGPCIKSSWSKSHVILKVQLCPWVKTVFFFFFLNFLWDFI